MEFALGCGQAVDRPAPGPVVVGWLREPAKGGVLYDPPERLAVRATNRAHAKSAARCPAVLNLESRCFQVPCPFDLRLGFVRDAEGRAALANRAGPASPIRAAKLAEVVTLVPEAEWRCPDRPTLQLKLPYLFLADEPVWLLQTDAFAHFRRDPLPGTILGGRFPIEDWPRPIMWAFEWHDISRELILHRGEPLFYLMFETARPDRPVQLVEAERTAELTAWIEHVAGAVNYVDQTFRLFRAARAARPQRAVVPVRRSEGGK